MAIEPLGIDHTVPDHAQYRLVLAVLVIGPVEDLYGDIVGERQQVDCGVTLLEDTIHADPSAGDEDLRALLDDFRTSHSVDNDVKLLPGQRLLHLLCVGVDGLVGMGQFTNACQALVMMAHIYDRCRA